MVNSAGGDAGTGDDGAVSWEDRKTQKACLERYRVASAEIIAVFHEVAPEAVVEKASIDEAYIDVTNIVDVHLQVAAGLSVTSHSCHLQLHVLGQSQSDRISSCILQATADFAVPVTGSAASLSHAPSPCFFDNGSKTVQAEQKKRTEKKRKEKEKKVQAEAVSQSAGPLPCSKTVAYSCNGLSSAQDFLQPAFCFKVDPSGNTRTA